MHKMFKNQSKKGNFIDLSIKSSKINRTRAK